jgi:hypothetical protein
LAHRWLRPREHARAHSARGPAHTARRVEDLPGTLAQPRPRLGCPCEHTARVADAHCIARAEWRRRRHGLRALGGARVTACADVNGGRPRRVAKMRRVIGWRVGQPMRPLDHTGRSPRPEGSRCGAHCRRSRRNNPKPRGYRCMRAFEGCAVRLLWLGGGGGGGRATCDGFVVRLCDRLVCLGLPARRRANKSVTGGGEGGAMSTTQRVRTRSRCSMRRNSIQPVTTICAGHDRRLKLGRSLAPRRNAFAFPNVRSYSLACDELRCAGAPRPCASAAHQAPHPIYVGAFGRPTTPKGRTEWAA